MRRSLYIKDDDYRLSFLHGDFVTLTNLTEAHFERIIRLNLSPLYVSIHAWDAECGFGSSAHRREADPRAPGAAPHERHPGAWPDRPLPRRE